MAHRLGRKGNLVFALKELGLRVAPHALQRLWTYYSSLLVRPRSAVPTGAALS